MSLLATTLMALSCAHVAQSPIVVNFTPPLARRGAVLAFQVDYVDGPFGPKPVPARCLSRWSVTGTAVRLDRRRRTLSIGARAVVGETAKLGFSVGGERVSKHFIVHGEDEAVLAGRWLRRDGACHLFPYVELVFTDNGKVTYTSPERMVETMSDGTLPYQWDADAGVIRSTLFQGGGARASITGDQMQLDAAQGCRLGYERR